MSLEVEGLLGIPSDQEFQRTLKMALGAVVLHFGTFEFGIVAIVATLYHERGGRDVYARLPGMLSQCLGFLEKCSHLLDRNPAQKVELTWIVGEGRRLAKIRNDLIHGYVASYDSEADHLLTFVKAKAKQKPDPIHVETLRRITAKELVEVANATLSLSQRTAFFADQLMS